LNPIRKQLVTLKEGIVKEKQTRVANEKAITKQLKADTAKMLDDIALEKQQRIEKMTDLEDYIKQDTALTSKFFDNFEKKAREESDKFIGDMEKELDNRFEHQDKMLDNMMRFVGKFQDTLKVFGKDV